MFKKNEDQENVMKGTNATIAPKFCYVCKREITSDEAYSMDLYGHKYCSDKCAIEACGDD